MKDNRSHGCLLPAFCGTDVKLGHTGKISPSTLERFGNFCTVLCARCWEEAVSVQSFGSTRAGRTDPSLQTSRLRQLLKVLNLQILSTSYDGVCKVAEALLPT